MARASTAFSAIGAYDDTNYNLTGKGDPEQVVGATVTAHFFETLGVRPLLGRVFGPEDEKQGAARLIVMSHGFWERRFGKDPSVVGQSVTLNGRPHTIIGVMPPEFVPPVRAWELMGPMKFDGDSRNARANHSLRVIARLKPGIAASAAR